MPEALDPLPLLRFLYDRGVEHVCGLSHLRAMKRAAGRPQDLEDLRHLGE